MNRPSLDILGGGGILQTVHQSLADPPDPRVERVSDDTSLEARAVGDVKVQLLDQAFCGSVPGLNVTFSRPAGDARVRVQGVWIVVNVRLHDNHGQ